MGSRRAYLILMLVAVALAAALGCGGDREDAVEEASGNFDMVDVEPLLRRISALTESGFAEQDAISLAAKISAQEIESEREYRYRVRAGGTGAELRVVVYVDDTDAPDIAFLTQPALAHSIQEAIEEYMAAAEK